MEPGKQIYYLIRGASGIGKTTFISYLLSRWLFDPNWYSKGGEKIDTILIQMYDSLLKQYLWGGFRKEKNGELLFFELERGCQPVRDPENAFKQSLLIRFANGQVHCRESITKVMRLEKEDTLFIFDNFSNHLDNAQPRLTVGIVSIGSVVRQRKARVWEKTAYVPLPTDSDMGRLC
jgi:hypothetical protein